VSEANPIRVFVSHTFQESDDYLRVFEFLESADRFFYLNCSKPENVPQTGGLEAIKDELIAQIKECEAVIILASQYIEQNDLTKYQMDVAAANDKPIIAIRPFGGVVETPQELIDRADEHIGWNDREMVDSLKRLARMEDTSRWETIEFTLD
jgi:nucleoside 2-deoxyribosyltransferase